MQFCRHTISATEKKILRRAILGFRDSQWIQEETVQQIASVLKCSEDDALGLANSSEPVHVILDRLGIEVAPDDEPELRVVWPQCDEAYERVELAVMLALGCGMAGVVVWAVWMWWAS